MWKDILGNEGYQVSSLGEVRSFKRGKERILVKCYDKDKYYLVGLWKNNKGRSSKVHRLVAIAFIPNPNNYPVVMHLDNDPSNNNVTNLKWGTVIDNNQQKQREGRANNHFISNNPRSNLGKFGKDHQCSKKVYQYTLEGEFIREWGSIIDIKREIGINQGNISLCCTGKRKTARGFVWRFKD